MAVRQTVVSDTNSPKTLTFNKLRGVDYSSSPFEVNTSRATSMKNMINEDGVNHKRNGWTEDTEINKMISEMNITNIKKTLDEWGTQSGIYSKFSRLATRVDYTRAIYLYFILSIQKYN